MASAGILAGFPVTRGARRLAPPSGGMPAGAPANSRSEPPITRPRPPGTPDAFSRYGTATFVWADRMPGKEDAMQWDIWYDLAVLELSELSDPAWARLVEAENAQGATLPDAPTPEPAHKA